MKRGHLEHLIRHGLVQRATLLERLGMMEFEPAVQEMVRGSIGADFAASQRS